VPLLSARVGAALCFESKTIYSVALILPQLFFPGVHGPYPNMTSRNRSLRCISIVLFGLACACALASPISVHAQVWQAMGPAGGDVRALASDPAHTEVLYLGATDGLIFTSRNAGADWGPLGLIGEN
jgi:hypothetical protein